MSTGKANVCIFLATLFVVKSGRAVPLLSIYLLFFGGGVRDGLIRPHLGYTLLV